MKPLASSLAEFGANNASALQRMRSEGSVNFARFGDGLLDTFKTISREVVAEIGSADPLSSRILASHTAFRETVRKWTEVSEGAYIAI